MTGQLPVNEALRLLVEGRTAWTTHVFDTGECFCGELIANAVGPEKFLNDHLPCADKRTETGAWAEATQRQGKAR